MSQTMIAMLEEAEDVLRRAGCDMTADRVRGVLQAQQAEPVAWINRHTLLGSASVKFGRYYLSPTRNDEDDMPLYAQPPTVAVPVCNWGQEDDGGSWISDCGQYFTLDDGDPSENGMKFCHGCGKRLAEHPWQDEGEEADESAMLAAAQKGGVA